MDHILFIYSSISGHLDCFHLLAIVNNAAMNIGVQRGIPLWFPIFRSSGHIPKSGLSGSYSSSMFNSLRNCWTVVYSCTILCSHQWQTRIPILPLSHRNPCYFLCFFLMYTILKIFIEFVTILLPFYVLGSSSFFFFFFFLFWLRGIWHLSFSGIKPIPSELEGKVATTGPPGKC